MNIYLLRHGQTPWNKEKRIQGREDVPLSEEGLLQAEESGKALKNKEITLILHSPLTRAKQTADAIAGYTGAKLCCDERLIERDFGPISGKVVEDIFAFEKYTDELEPLFETAARMAASLCEHAERAGGNIAAVSHGGSISALLRILSGKTDESIRLKNACISILTWDGNLKISDYDLSAEEFIAKYC